MAINSDSLQSFIDSNIVSFVTRKLHSNMHPIIVVIIITAIVIFLQVVVVVVVIDLL